MQRVCTRSPVGKNYSDFESLRPQLLGLARMLLSSARVRIEPEDLVQTVLTEIYAKLQTGTEIKNPRPTPTVR